MRSFSDKKKQIQKNDDDASKNMPGLPKQEQN